MACITLSRNVDFSALILWILLHEVVQEHVKVITYSIFAKTQALELADKTETST